MPSAWTQKVRDRCSQRRIHADIALCPTHRKGQSDLMTTDALDCAAYTSVPIWLVPVDIDVKSYLIAWEIVHEHGT